MNPSRYIGMAVASFVILLVGLALLVFMPSSQPAQASRAQPVVSPPSVLYLPFVSRSLIQTAVSLKNIAYNPQSITITLGTQVKWTNDETSAISHTVTSGTPPTPDGKFDSFPPDLAPGQSFQFIFTSTGTYPYYCRIHLSFMTGTITVVP